MVLPTSIDSSRVEIRKGELKIDPMEIIKVARHGIAMFEQFVRLNRVSQKPYWDNLHDEIDTQDPYEAIKAIGLEDAMTKIGVDFNDRRADWWLIYKWLLNRHILDVEDKRA